MFISLTTLGLISAATLLSIARMSQLSTEIDSRRDGRYPIYHTKRNSPNVDLYQHSPPLFLASTSVGKHQLPKPEKRHLLERFVNRIFRRPTKADIPPSRYRTRNHRPSPIMTPSLHQFPHLMGSSEPFPFMVAADGAIIEQPSPHHHSDVRFPGESISYNNPPLLAESNSHYSYQFGQPAPMKPERNIHWPHSKTTYNNRIHHSEFPPSQLQFPLNHHSSSSIIHQNYKSIPSTIGAPPSTNKQKKSKSSYSTKLKKLIFYHGNGAPKHRKYRYQYQYDHPHRPGDGMVETVDEHHYFDEDEDNNDGDDDDDDEDGDNSENIDDDEEDDEIKHNQKVKLQKDKEEIDEKLDNRKYYTKFEDTAQQPSLPSDDIYRNNSLLLLSPSKHRYRYVDHRRTTHHGKSKPPQSTETKEDEMPLVNCPPPGGTSGSKPINYHYHMYLVKQGESDSSQDVYPGGGGIHGPDSSSPSKIYYPLKDNHKNHNHKKKSSHKPTTKDPKVPKAATTTTTTAKVPNHRYSDYQQHASSDDGSTFYYESSGKEGATNSHRQTENHQLNSDYYNRILMKKIFDMNPASKVMPIENYITESSASLNSPTNYGNHKRPAKFEASNELKMDTKSKLYVPIAAASSKTEETLGSNDTKKKSNNGSSKSKKLEINSSEQKEIII